MDKVTERRHYLNLPVIARYVRFHPIAWHKRIGLRAGVIGCKHSGDCGPGFMRVNTGSLCSKFCSKITNNDNFIQVFLENLHSILITDDEYCRYGYSSGRGKGGSVICFKNITYELW
jgi:hypothetical protein